VSKHWKPDNNVVRGRFGRRVAVRPAQPRQMDTGWLSPEAYRALSPEERRLLHARRALARDARQSFAPSHRRTRRGSTKSKPREWLVAIGLVGMIWVTEFGLPIPTAMRAHSAPVTASFGYCFAGGGTNCVVDGDTFYIGGQKVRIAGIDAPETHDYDCESELALGDRATEKLQALLNSGAVTMSGIGRDRDVFVRLLRNVQVNVVDVGAAMVGAGVARVYGGGRRSWC
jgi:endonuclease YncB( thermonuclease family)